MAPPSLLGLPLELRYRIFAYLYLEIPTFTWPFRYFEGRYMCINVATSGVPQASILRTNRQLRDDHLDMGRYDAVSIVFYVIWRTEMDRESLLVRLIDNGNHPDHIEEYLERALDLKLAAERTKQVETILLHVRHVNVTEGRRQDVLGDGVVARTRERSIYGDY